MSIPVYQVNAFISSVFLGNPAAVVLLDQAGDTAWMQSVAREMGLSETAFVHPQIVGFSLRWFTPETEVDLCGHATLASAHVLWECGRLPVESPARFLTLSGKLTARRVKKMIELDFPASKFIPGDLSAEIVKAVGVVPDQVVFSGEKWLLELQDESIVAGLQPDFNALRQVAGRGMIVTSRSDKPGVDFVSRYFAPWIGVDEDPVTGSAHTILGPYWGEKLGKTYMTAHQVSARGGLIHVRLSGERVYIGGEAITIQVGELEFPE